MVMDSFHLKNEDFHDYLRKCLISQNDYALRNVKYLVRHCEGHTGGLNQARVKHKPAPLLQYKEMTQYSVQIFLHSNTSQQ